MSGRGLWNRLSEMWRKGARERDMDDEFASLVEMETEANLRAGMPAEQARRVARMKLGVEQTKEKVRDQRGLPALETFLQDLRYGLRSLRKSPGFAAVAVITIALGIGANTAMFSAIDAVLLKRFPYRDPERLVMVWEKKPELQGFFAERMPVRTYTYVYWKQHAQTFEDMSAAMYDAVNISGNANPEHVERAAVTSNFFQVLGVAPAIGRAFTPEETNGATARVAMISYATYQQRFGGAHDVLQRDIEIDGVPYRIVGVLPAEFYLTAMWAGFDRAKPEVWTPLNIKVAKPESDFQNMVYGRLKPGVTLAQARSEVAVLEAQLVQQFPKEYDKHDRTNVFTLFTEDVAPDLRRGLLVLQLAVGFVLLLACVNVANLMLARSENRQREMALRMALGASRGRVTRQVITESLLLSALGAVPGLALAWVGTKLVAKLAPADITSLHELTLDTRVLAFTAATAVVAGIVFGLAPALHLNARNLLERVSRGGRGGTRGMSKRFRAALVVAEVALALAPLAGAGLMIRTLRAMNALDLGIRTDHVVDGRLALPEVQYKTKEQVRAFDNDLLDKAAAAPGVEAVALAGGPPMQSINFTSFHLDGESTDREQTVDASDVSDGYFGVVGTPVLRGRDFTRQEAEQDASVTVISESVARKLWPNADAIGKGIVIREKRYSVIGTVPDIRVLQIGTDVRPSVYFPTRNLRYLALIVRAHGSTEVVKGELAGIVRSIDRTLPLYNVHTFNEVVRESVTQQRFTMTLFMVFAALALVLAGVGIYGVVSYGVAQRTQEIGVRMALGARGADVLRMIVGQGVRAVAIGAVIGVVGTVLLTRAMAGLLFGVKTYDPITFAVVVGVLVVVSLAASYVPARRAAKVDPMEALRTE